MSYRTMEVTLISAKDLKQVNWFSKMRVYAIVSLSGDPGSQQCTPCDRKGDRNPTWSCTLRFNVPADTFARQELHILLRAERALGNRDVGQVHIPLSELLDDAAAAAGDGPEYVTYQVRSRTSDKPKGVLNLSYMIDGRIAAPTPAPPSVQPYQPPAVYLGYLPPPYGYALPPHQATYGYPPVGCVYAPPLAVVQPPKKNEFVVHTVTAVCSVWPPMR